MFIALTTGKNPRYRGVDRDCEPYENVEIGVFGNITQAEDAAWNDYIDLLGNGSIPYNDEALKAMMRIVSRSKENDLEIILYTKDIDECCGPEAIFLGFDVVGTEYSSVLAEGACRNIPVEFSESLNGSGLLDGFDQAAELARYANSLTAADIEPEFPYAPVKVYKLK